MIELTPYAVKLACLSLAAEAKTDDTMSLAKEMYEWATEEVEFKENRSADVSTLKPVN